MQKLWIAVIACALMTQACTTPTQRIDNAHPATAPADVVYGQGTHETIWVNNPPPGFLPTGMTHHTYFSQSMHHEVGYCIYLPPSYQKNPRQRFPVIYDLHGINRNELHGMLAAQLLQQGIQAGKWPDMIMVFPNAGSQSFYQDHADTNIMAETTIIRELIPYIDQT